MANGHVGGKTGMDASRQDTNAQQEDPTSPADNYRGN